MLVSIILSNCCKNRYLEILALEGLTKWHVNTAICNWSKINEEDTVALFEKTNCYYCLCFEKVSWVLSLGFFGGFVGFFSFHL